MRKRFAGCGRPLGIGDVGVNVGHGEHGLCAAYQAIAHCSSPWACAVCAAKIRSFRAREVEQIMRTWHEDLGGGAYLVTLTIPHHRDDALGELLDKMADAWRRLVSWRAWKKWKEKVAEGSDLDLYYIRALEITLGWINGWHPHHHMLLLVPHAATEEEAEELRGLLRELWKRACELVGLEIPSDEHGVDVKAVGADWQRDAAAYVAKIVDAFAAEVANPNTKSAKEGNIVPLQLLDMEDDPWARDRWCEYVLATKGRRAIWTSRGLRAVCKMGEALTDEEIVERDEREDVHLVATIARKAYVDVWHRDQTDLARALSAIERHDWGAASRIFGCGMRVRLDVSSDHDPRERGREAAVLRHDFKPIQQTARYIVEMRPEYRGEAVDEAALALVDNESWRRLLPSNRPRDDCAERHRRGRASGGAQGKQSATGRLRAAGAMAGEPSAVAQGEQMALAI